MIQGGGYIMSNICVFCGSIASSYKSMALLRYLVETEASPEEAPAEEDDTASKILTWVLLLALLVVLSLACLGCGIKRRNKVRVCGKLQHMTRSTKVGSARMPQPQVECVKCALLMVADDRCYYCEECDLIYCARCKPRSKLDPNPHRSSFARFTNRKASENKTSADPMSVSAVSFAPVISHTIILHAEEDHVEGPSYHPGPVIEMPASHEEGGPSLSSFRDSSASSEANDSTCSLDATGHQRASTTSSQYGPAFFVGGMGKAASPATRGSFFVSKTASPREPEGNSFSARSQSPKRSVKPELPKAEVV